MSDEIIDKQQILKHKVFLTRLAIIPVFNITPEIM